MDADPFQFGRSPTFAPKPFWSSAAHCEFLVYSTCFRRFPSAVQVPGCEFNSNIQLLVSSLSPAMLTSLAPLPIVFAWSTDYVSYLADVTGNCKGLYLGVVIAHLTVAVGDFGLANIPMKTSWAQILRKVRNLSRRSTVCLQANCHYV